MTKSASHIPDWRSYADRVVARTVAELTAPIGGRGATQDDAQGKTHPDTHLSADAGAQDGRNRSAQQGGSPSASAPTSAPQSRRTPLPFPGRIDADAPADDADGAPLSPPQLLMAIRLAATLGSEGTMRPACAPGALTLVIGFRPTELDLAEGLIGLQVLAPDQPISLDGGVTLPAETARVLIPAQYGGEISASHLQQFHSRIERLLLQRAALLILAPDRSSLPFALQGGGTSALTLAPLCREILLASLAHSHGARGGIDEAALHALLPEDRHLARLDATGLALALRQPGARAVAEHLADLAATDGQDGPRLEDLTGNSPALRAARRLIADLQLWQAGGIGWSELSRSLLLYGPPGTGKTWLARAMGNSAGVAMVTGSFAEWQAAGHLGDLLREMRRTFAEARRLAPSLLFIDEIDAVGSRSDGDRHNDNYRTQVINGFLAEMDMISREAGVIVVAACNNPDRIDPAVLRAGRFDLRIAVPLPDASAIQGILRRNLDTSFNDDDLTALTRAATGQSAAEIDAAIRAAHSEARQAGRPLSLQDLLAQFGASPSAERQVVDRRMAIHECGHALVAAALNSGRVTCMLITREGGETHRRKGDAAGLTRDYEAEIAVQLAGRAAERLILGEISSGAGGSTDSDLAQATRLAVKIDTQLGLGASGTLWRDLPAEFALRDPELRASITQRLDRAEARATEILTAHRTRLVEMAGALQHSRELSEAEIADGLAPLIAARDAGEADGPTTGGLPGDRPCAGAGASQGDAGSEPGDRSSRASGQATLRSSGDHSDPQSNPLDDQGSPVVEQANPISGRAACSDLDFHDG